MQKLHRLFVVNKKGFYSFKCKCNQTITLRGDSKLKACGQEGCTETTRRKHGDSSTRLYGIWEGMRSRCIGTHKTNVHYKNKGIHIAPSWAEFSVFKKWALSNGYTDSLCIDRINIDGNYEPFNCEWVTRAENTRRQVIDGHTNTVEVMLNGVKFKSIISAAREVEKTTGTNLRTAQTLLENRIKSNSLKPYKGYIICKINKEVQS